MNTILGMQPGVSEGGAGKANDEMVDELASNILEKLEGFKLNVEHPVLLKRKSVRVSRSSRPSVIGKKSAMNRRSVYESRQIAITLCISFFTKR